MTIPVSDKARLALKGLERFYATSLDAELARHSSEAPEAAALELFRRTLSDVPAYPEFLRAAGFEPGVVREPADFSRIPPTTKDSYHRRHGLSALCRGGRLDGCDMLAVSSGSTGEPTIWPRFVSDELGTAFRDRKSVV